MQRILFDASQDPAKFLKDLPPAQQAQIRSIASQIEKKQSFNSKSSPATKP